MNKVAFTVLVTLLFLFCTFSISNAGKQTTRSSSQCWDWIYVDSGDVRDYSMAVDSSDNIHVLYVWKLDWKSDTYDLKYSKLTGDQWVTETIYSEAIIRCPEIEIDSSNTPHIIYYDYDSDELIYRKKTGSSWSFNCVASDDDVISEATFELDSNNNPCICYLNNECDVIFAKWEGSDWNRSCANDWRDPEYLGLKLDSNNSPHIIHSGGAWSEFHYINLTEFGWNKVRLDGDANDNCDCSIVIDKNDHPHIVYEGPQGLIYKKWDGIDWITKDLNSDGYSSNPRILFDENEHLKVCYLADYENKIKYATWDGSSWTEEVVDPLGERCDYPVFDLDSDYDPHICYFEREYEDLFYGMVSEGSKPNPPTALQIEAGDENITVTWEPPEPDGGLTIRFYYLYCSNISGIYEETPFEILENELTYYDNNLENGETLFFQITAVNAMGESEPSIEINATPLMEDPPWPINDLKAEISNNGILLSWGLPWNHEKMTIDRYNIYRSIDIDSFGNVPYASVVDELFYFDDDVTNKDTYYYFVAGENEYGETEFYDQHCVLITFESDGIVNLEPPLNLKATPGYGRVLLSWEPPSSGIGGIRFELFRGTSEDDIVHLRGVYAWLTEYEDRFNIEDGQTYYYYMTSRWYNMEGVDYQDSEPSNTVSVTARTEPEDSTPMMGGITIFNCFTSGQEVPYTLRHWGWDTKDRAWGFVDGIEFDITCSLGGEFSEPDTSKHPYEGTFSAPFVNEKTSGKVTVTATAEHYETLMYTEEITILPSGACPDYSIVFVPFHWDEEKEPLGEFPEYVRQHAITVLDCLDQLDIKNTNIVYVTEELDFSFDTNNREGFKDHFYKIKEYAINEGFSGNRYVAITNTDIWGSVCGLASGFYTDIVVAEAFDPHITAHELGHSWGLLDEYNKETWEKQRDYLEYYELPVPNSYPGDEPGLEGERISSYGEKFDGDKRCIMGPAGLPYERDYGPECKEWIEDYIENYENNEYECEVVIATMTFYEDGSEPTVESVSTSTLQTEQVIPTTTLTSDYSMNVKSKDGEIVYSTNINPGFVMIDDTTTRSTSTDIINVDSYKMIVILPIRVDEDSFAETVDIVDNADGSSVFSSEIEYKEEEEEESSDESGSSFWVILSIILILITLVVVAGIIVAVFVFLRPNKTKDADKAKDQSYPQTSQNERTHEQTQIERPYKIEKKDSTSRTETQKNKCPSCGQEIDSGWKACAFCGKDIDRNKKGNDLELERW